ncbi:MAG: double-strand break repair protein AddB, partial [Silicimonas sp.]|nr:double-strand break repair protein AddB [Silicimonas sp.]
MFEPSDIPRVFGVPPGADFPQVLVNRVLGHYLNAPPEDLARVRILVNTRRMHRRLSELFQAGGARLLPRIGLVTDVDALCPGADLPLPVSPLRRRLELAQLTARLIDKEPELAARSAAVDLADSLATLLDEMQGEGVSPEQFAQIDVGDESQHWERSRKFLKVASDYTDQISSEGMDSEARRRRAIELVGALWATSPPSTPVIVAGSTGSRAATSLLMHAAARLPKGALVLPGFDKDLPDAVWDTLSSSRDMEDHPQYRFAALLTALGITRDQVTLWGEPPDPKRNALISMSLRPAHVSDQWLSEGPRLGDLIAATSRVSLIEAPQPKTEALAIAVALRESVDQGKRAALVTTDRTLARRVSATLSRWDILPDDSAGTPLSLTAPGRFLRHVANMIGRPVPTDELFALLKHPLTRTGVDDRPRHLEIVRACELFVRKNGIVTVTPAVLSRFAKDRSEDVQAWAAWLSDLLARLDELPAPTLNDAVAHHRSLAEAFANGPGGGTGALWDKDAGSAVEREIARFQDEQDFGGRVTFTDYVRLLEKALAAESDRDSERTRPDVMIWGTLEARVQGATRVILGGMVEGQWPEQPGSDPWLNRRMRRELGLLLPEREIGLSAHDYQQAAAAEEVILSLSKRTEDSDAVPSRWLNRLTNLLQGLPDLSGPTALDAMTGRGQRYLDLAALLDTPGESTVLAASRPAPAPPASKRPKSLSVTEIQTLIRDPYAIYAKHVLGIRALEPLIPSPDARLKGIVFHEILEDFFALDADFSSSEKARERLSGIIMAKFNAYVPWSATRVEWRAALDGVTDWLIETERRRREGSISIAREVKGELRFPTIPMTIKGTADRIDALEDGTLVIYDYKTGTLPKT